MNTLGAALLLATFTLPVAAQSTDRLEGNIDSVNLVSNQLTVNGVVFQIDIPTRLLDFGGAAIPLSAFQVPELVRVDYFVGATPQIADSVRKLDPPPPTMTAPTLDLNVAPGAEATPTLRVYGDDPGDALGGAITGAIAYGDIDADGYDDLVVGAHLAALTGVGNVSGEVHVIYGSSSRPATTVNLDTNDVVASLNETRIHPPKSGELFGCSLAVADFDSDGFDDIAIGSLGASDHGPNSGAVHIVWGHRRLRGRIVDLSTDPSATRFLGDNQQELFGYSLAAGDLDGDGIQDLVAGAPGSYFFAARRQGFAAILFGRRGMRGCTYDLATDGEVSPLGETRIYGRGLAERAGSSLATGDFNGDGYDDVLIGAEDADSVFFDVGAAYVVYGGPFLPASLIPLSTTGLTYTRVSGQSGNANAGQFVAAGDVNNDGFDDLVVSSPGVTGAGDNFATGEVVVIHGHANLPGAVIDLLGAAGTQGEARVLGAEEHGRLGESLGVGDWNGDGFDDLLLGAPGTVPLGATETNSVNDGALFVVRGERLTSGAILGDPREVANLMVLADNGNDQLGSGCRLGADFNRDGLVDYAAGAQGGDNPGLAGNNNAGLVVAIFGVGSPADVSRSGFAHAGDAGRLDFGPTVRAALDFQSGAGLSPSAQTAALLHAALPSQAGGTFASMPMHWNLTTDRTGYKALVDLDYTDAEALGLDENRLMVFQSATGLAGTWTPAGSRQTRDPHRNRIRVHGVDELGLFVIAQASLVTRFDGRLAIGGEDRLEFELDAGVAQAGRVYLMSGSLSGTRPGFTLQGLQVPLNPDDYYIQSSSNPNSGPLENTLGFLDAQGRARATVHASPGLDLSLVGLRLHHAYGVLVSGSLAFVSNAAPAQFVRAQGKRGPLPTGPTISVTGVLAQ